MLQTIAMNAKDFNFVQFLQDIATEQSFEVTYVDIEEKTLSGTCQCLVQLSTLPVAVCCGTGKTPKDAQASAAHHALEYLKIMTKKWTVPDSLVKCRANIKLKSSIIGSPPPSSYVKVLVF